MNATILIPLAILVGSAPLLLCSLHSIKQWGLALWLFSPLPTFIFAYIVAFGFVPYLESAFSIRIYEGFNIDERSFQFAELLGIIACWAFAFGFLLYNRPRPAPQAFPAEPTGNRSASYFTQRARDYQNITFLFAIILQCLFTGFLLSSHALSLNFGENRRVFLASLLGAGYITLINLLAFDILMLGLLLCLWSRRLGSLGIISLLLFLIPNYMITNRGIITSLFYLLVFIYFLRTARAAKKINPLRLFGILAVIVALGALIGLSRGIGGEPADDTPTTASEAALQSFPPFVRGAVFLTYTFDMGVLLEKTVSRSDDPEWGYSWLEDLGYTFLPRAFFPDKPILFGAIRLQEKVAPEIYGDNINIGATYPIGIFAESYANFGVPGVFLCLFLLGLGLKYWYSQCVAISYTNAIHWKSLMFTVLYTTLCSNSLPYMRSLGQFLALLFFLGALLLLSVALIQSVGHKPVPARTPEMIF